QFYSVSLLVDKRPASFESCFYRLNGIDLFYLQLDLPASDSRNVQKIIHEVDKVTDLAVDNVCRPLHLRLVKLEFLQHFDCASDWCQRIAELMRKHGEKFVFAAIALLNALVEHRIFQGNSTAVCQVLRNRLLIVRKFRSGLRFTEEKHAESPNPVSQRYEHDG